MDLGLRLSLRREEPSGRYSSSAVWTGSKMLIWGGLDASGGAGVQNTGGVYNPAMNAWTAMTTTSQPGVPQWTPLLFWTGSEALVYGTGGVGGRYTPNLDPDL